MPIKDLTGPPPPTAEELALIDEMARRLGLPPPRRSGRRGDGPEPAPAPRGPSPVPLAGAGEADPAD